MYKSFIATVEPVPPSALVGWVAEMKLILDTTPQQLREGIDRYENLHFSELHDDHHRAIFIAKYGRLLRCHDGAGSALRQLRGQFETWFAEWAELHNETVS